MTPMLIKSLQAIRRASYVERCHTEKIIGSKQTLGHHQYNVAMLARLITNGDASVNLICVCLDHDIPECVMGDSPAQAKREHPKLKIALDEIEEQFFIQHGTFFHRVEQLISKDERCVLKIADSLDLLFYCTEQRMFGNRWVDSMYHNAWKIVLQYENPKNKTWLNNINLIQEHIVTLWSAAI